MTGMIVLAFPQVFLWFTGFAKVGVGAGEMSSFFPFALQNVTDRMSRNVGILFPIFGIRWIHSCWRALCKMYFNGDAWNYNSISSNGQWY